MYGELYHHGILGMKWGVRRYQNPDGSLTAAGKKRYAMQQGAADFAERRARGDKKKAEQMINSSRMSKDWEDRYLGKNGVQNYIKDHNLSNHKITESEMKIYGVKSTEQLAKLYIQEERRSNSSASDRKYADHLVNQGQQWAKKATEIRNKKIDEITNEEVRQYEKMVKNLKYFRYFPEDSGYWTDSPDLYKPKKKKG